MHQVTNKMAATGDSIRQAVDLDNLIQEYMHFEKVSLKISVSVFLILGRCFQQRPDFARFLLLFGVRSPSHARFVFQTAAPEQIVIDLPSLASHN